MNRGHGRSDKLSALLAVVGLGTCALVAACTGPSQGQLDVVPAVAPEVPPVQLCSHNGILNSPYSYDGEAGTFTSKTAPRGLPTFGIPGTDFPRDTMIVVVPAGNNTSAAGSDAYQADNAIFYFEPGMH